jgi:urease accessory protein
LDPSTEPILVERLPEEPPRRDSEADVVVLTWEERAKTRQRLRSRAGRAIGMKLATGTRLPPGTVVYVGDGFHVTVEAADEDVWMIRCAEPRDLVRVAYEIGNRHFPIELGDDHVAVRYDHTLDELWARLGVCAVRATRPFLSDQRPSHHH